MLTSEKSRPKPILYNRIIGVLYRLKWISMRRKNHKRKHLKATRCTDTWWSMINKVIRDLLTLDTFYVGIHICICMYIQKQLSAIQKIFLCRWSKAYPTQKYHPFRWHPLAYIHSIWYRLYFTVHSLQRMPSTFLLLCEVGHCAGGR